MLIKFLSVSPLICLNTGLDKYGFLNFVPVTLRWPRLTPQKATVTKKHWWLCKTNTLGIVPDSRVYLTRWSETFPLCWLHALKFCLDAVNNIAACLININKTIQLENPQPPVVSLTVTGRYTQTGLFSNARTILLSDSLLPPALESLPRFHGYFTTKLHSSEWQVKRLHCACSVCENKTNQKNRNSNCRWAVWPPSKTNAWEVLCFLCMWDYYWVSYTIFNEDSYSRPLVVCVQCFFDVWQAAIAVITKN